MDIKLHKLARTTPATRRYIQTAPKSAATLARELGVALTTIYKWKRAGRVHDGSHVRAPAPCQYLPRAGSPHRRIAHPLRLSLDDVTEVLNRCSATPLSRSAIHRCLVRLGVARLNLPRRAAGGAVRGHPLGYIHLDLKVLSKLQKQPSYVAIDRATRYVWVKVLATAATVTQAVEEFPAQSAHHLDR